MNNMKKFLGIVFALLIVGILLMCVYAVMARRNLKHDKRGNTECLTDERIFDYIDKLSSSEKEKLMDSIDDIEETVGMDMVIVIIDYETDLSEIGLTNAGTLSSQTVAEEFCNYYMFGWEEWAQGGPVNGRMPSTSAVIVANWDSGDAWMCTSGRALDRISDSRASDIVQKGCNYLRENPLKGFETMIAGVEKAMRGNGHSIHVSKIWCYMIPLVIAIVFFIANFSKKAGKTTTKASTYSRGGKADVLNRQDIFVNKTVTSVRISSDSQGGGGGGSSSGGGSGHGGGGGHF